MTGRDLVYFLQGLFELGDPKTLDTRQVDLIRRHLAMVWIHDPKTEIGFCRWLEGFTELQTQLDEGQTLLVREKLAAVFIHVIDPSFPDHEQAALDAAHQGKLKVIAPGTGVSTLPAWQRPPNGDTVYRC